MTNIDDLFKAPTSKRKLDPVTDARAHYKTAKLSANGDVKNASRNLQPTADNDDEDTNDNDNEDDSAAGPDLPPDLDEPEDEEGRFFGRGVTRTTDEAMAYMNDHDQDSAPSLEINTAYVRQLATSLRKKIAKNTEMRAKYEDDPHKFMASEADLDEAIKGLGVLTDHTSLYSDFAEAGCGALLVSVVAHENTDLGIDAVAVMAELTDDDTQAEEGQWDALVDALLEAGLAGVLVGNLARLKEENEADREGVYHTLSLVENLASRPSAVEVLAESGELIKYLMARARKTEVPVTQNKQYSAEVLAILLQTSRTARRTAADRGAVDMLLEILNQYRTRDPTKDSVEEEFAENAWDALACLVSEEDGRKTFLTAEGVELCLILLEEAKFSRRRALRVLDHAMSGQSDASVSERLVTEAGLKPVFHAFMKKLDRMETEHLLGIFASMLRLLPHNSAPRIRTLAKFYEKEYQKIEKLFRLRIEYGQRLSRIDEEIHLEKSHLDEEGIEEKEAEWLSRRLDAGLFCFQTIDVILAWLIAEDSGAREIATTLLKAQRLDLSSIEATLKEQIAGLEGDSSEDAEAAADMLRTLVECLA